MRILAIDPGETESGLVALDGNKIIFHGNVNNDHILKFNEHSLKVPIDYVAIEMMASFGMAVGKSVFNTCVWIGRFYQHFQPRPVRLVYRMEVKMYFCHSMKAKDSNIRQAIIDRFGPPGKKHSPGPTYGIVSHEWSALAIALYARDKIISPI